MSSVYLCVDFNRHDVRLPCQIRLHFDVNPWLPRKAKSEEHVPINYHLEAEDGQGFDEDRIQDLLRQDEAARAGSSCVE